MFPIPVAKLWIWPARIPFCLGEQYAIAPHMSATYANSFRPELQNTHHTVLQGAENSQHIKHSAILAVSQEHLLLADQPTLLSDILTVVPNRPAPASYEPTLLPNRSTMEPNQNTPLPNHSDRSTMGLNQLAQ